MLRTATFAALAAPAAAWFCDGAWLLGRAPRHCGCRPRWGLLLGPALARPCLTSPLVAPFTPAALARAGHMLVAQVALKSGIMSSTTIDKVNTLIAKLADDYPASPDFIQAACWADDLKSMDAPQEASWHFIDIPVVRDNVVPTQPPAINAVWAVDTAHSTVYSKYSTDLDKARQLRFIVHVCGDLHQPLHAASLFSSQFPNGDRGGNSYPIAGVSWTNELHAFMDGGAGQWTGDLSRPLNATGAAWVSDFADKIMAQWPVTSLQPYIKEYNTSSWVRTPAPTCSRLPLRHGGPARCAAPPADRTPR